MTKVCCTSTGILSEVPEYFSFSSREINYPIIELLVGFRLKDLAEAPTQLADLININACFVQSSLLEVCEYVYNHRIQKHFNSDLNIKLAMIKVSF